jgi:colanic acid biosynthesis protein WcaH
MDIPKEQYRKIIEKMPICCVDLVVTHKGKALLILREDEPAKGEWSIPGGRVFKSEALEDAVKRKAKEELGINVTIKKMIGVYQTMYEQSAFGCSTHTINIAFVVETKENTIKSDGSWKEYKWVTTAKENIHDYAKKLLEDSELFDKQTNKSKDVYHPADPFHFNGNGTSS